MEAEAEDVVVVVVIMGVEESCDGSLRRGGEGLRTRGDSCDGLESRRGNRQ